MWNISNREFGDFTVTILAKSGVILAFFRPVIRFLFGFILLVEIADIRLTSSSDGTDRTINLFSKSSVLLGIRLCAPNK